MLPEVKIMLISAIHIETFASERRKYRFLLRDLDLNFQGHETVRASAKMCQTFNIFISLKW